MAPVSAALPAISVVTTTDRPVGLDVSLQSLLGQTEQDWEWLVTLTGGARWRPAVNDPRLRLVVDDRVAPGTPARRMACALALGASIVELDDGDELLPDALATIRARLDANPDIAMLVGGSCHPASDSDWLAHRYDPAVGWSQQPVHLAGREVVTVDDLATTPHNVADPRYLSDHVLAYRRSIYEDIDGYDASTDLARHDLICRMYQHAGVELIGRPVYLERPRDGAAEAPSWWAEAEASYRRHLEPNALAWCGRSNLTALDLGIADDPPAGYAVLAGSDGGRVPAPSFAAGSGLDSDSVGLIRAYDLLPRVRDKVAFFNEAYRVLAHGGVLLTLTPSSDGRGAFQDPAHIAYYNEHSFWYFTDEELRRFVPQIRCRFLAAELLTFYPSDWHEAHLIPYVRATLIAIKDGPRQGGHLAV